MTPNVVNKGPRASDPRNLFCRNLDVPSDEQVPQPAIVRPPRPYDPRGMIARVTDTPTDEWDLPTKDEIVGKLVEHIVEPIVESIQRPKRALHKAKSMCSSVKGHVFSHAGPATELPTEGEMQDTQSIHSFPAANFPTMHANQSMYSFKTMLRSADAGLMAEDTAHGGVALRTPQTSAFIADGAHGLNLGASHSSTAVGNAQNRPPNVVLGVALAAIVGAAPGYPHGATAHDATTHGAAADTVLGNYHGTTITTDGTHGPDPGTTTLPTDSVDPNQRVRTSWIALNANPGERVRSLYVDDGGIAAEVNVVQQLGHKSIHIPGYDHGLGHHPSQTGRLPNPASSTENISTAYKVNWQMTALTELIHNSIVDITKSMASDLEGVQRVRTAGGVFVPLSTVKAGLLEFQEYYAEFLQHGGLNGNKVMGGEAYLLAMVGKRSEIDNGTLKLVEFKECEK